MRWGGGHVHPLQISASGSVLCGIKAICEVFILFFLIILAFFFFFFLYFYSIFYFFVLLSLFLFLIIPPLHVLPLSSVSCSLLTGTAGTENNVVSAK